MASYLLDSGVEEELWEIWAYIAADNPVAATAVLDASHAMFRVLAANPRMGAARKFRNSRLRGIRSVPVAGYPNYLIFYRAMPGGVQIIHVLHGARDLEALFAE